MAVKFGLLFRPQDPPDARNLRRRWEDLLEAAVLAEESGFDGVFLPEHHMQADGYLPAPLIGASAIAARTRRVDIGTTIFLLPLYHPVHVAEEAAMLDVISQGRFILGCGMANFEPEFDLYGIPKRQQVSRFEEGIELIQRLWAGEELDFDGRRFQVKGRISPLPGNPRMWLGAQSDVGARRAGRLGLTWATDPLHHTAVIRAWADAYNEAAAEHGHPCPRPIALLRDGWVCDSRKEAERVWWPHALNERWFYFSSIPRWYGADLDPEFGTVNRREDFDFDRHWRGRLPVGSPDDVVESLQEMLAEIPGVEYVVMSLRMASGPSYEQERECIARFGREVIPRFADVAAGVDAR
jgi:alkanesulfonate monooxygenase SsuD/methylene tetrahydromethanopterin reductase-like flavin-dependent oxidoreductase (luciferase family)